MEYKECKDRGNGEREREKKEITCFSVSMRSPSLTHLDSNSRGIILRSCELKN